MPGEMPPLPLLAAGALLLCAIGTFLFRRRASALLSSLDSLSKERGKGATTEKLIVEHDVVVLGAGCSACALVSTLVKGGKRVLLLEGGEEDVYRHPAVVKSANWWGAAWGGDPTSHQYLTVPQKGMGGRRLLYPRGKGVGGTGNVNASIWSRGRREDYTSWPWAIEDIDASFAHVERTIGVQYIAPAAPGDAMLQMAEEAGIPRHTVTVPTWITPGAEPGSFSTSDKKSGDRISGWARFIAPLLADPDTRDLLTVVGGVTATQLVLQRQERQWASQNRWCAAGVEVRCHSRAARTLRECGASQRTAPEEGRDGGGGEVVQVMLGKVGAEVVVCAGAIDTPKLLLLSGIGPSDQLSEVGVKPVAELPQVGKNLQDHLLVIVTNICRKPNAARETNVLGMHGWVHLEAPGKQSVDIMFKDASNVWQLAPALLPSMFLPQSESIFWGAARRMFAWVVRGAMAVPFVRSESQKGVLAGLCLMGPKSRGHVTISSSDPSDPPQVDPNFLSAESDVAALRFALEAYRKMQATETGVTWMGPELLPGPLYSWGSTKGGEARYLQQTGMSFFHPAGTCRMGEMPLDSVVDGALRVHGVDALRIADASIAPSLPSAPTQAMAYMIGHRAGVLMLSA